jgi:translation elongation factor EF-G
MHANKQNPIEYIEAGDIGAAVGFKDIIVSKEMNEKMQQIITNSVIESKYNITQYENDAEQLPLDISDLSLGIKEALKLLNNLSS